MLDQLIESKSNAKENRTRGGYLLTTFVLFTGLFFTAGLWSLFARDLGLSGEGFELSALVAPAPPSEDAPPAPLPKSEKPEKSANTKSAVIFRQTNMLRIEESPVAPDKISVAPNAQKARPNGNFLVSDDLSSGTKISSAGSGRAENGGASGLRATPPTLIENPEKIIAAPPLPPVRNLPVETIEKSKSMVSGGVVNGQAKSLPKPPFPAAAKAVGASGQVNVQVTIDEIGKVISAKALDGHPLLRPAAEKAARSAEFKPTLLTGKPVRVSGVIVYKFSPQ